MYASEVETPPSKTDRRLREQNITFEDIHNISNAEIKRALDVRNGRSTGEDSITIEMLHCVEDTLLKCL